MYFFILNWKGKASSSFLFGFEEIVYDNSYPLLFNEGDFIITTPENVRAIIEVKTAIESSQIQGVIKKATKNKQNCGLGQPIF